MRRTVWAAALLGMMVVPASAALTAYDGFDYTVDQDMYGQNGGFGWSTAWNEQWTMRVLSGSLSYTDSGGRALVTTGNSMRNISNYPKEARFLTNGIGAGETAWVSFLMSKITIDGGASYGRQRIWIRPEATEANGVWVWEYDDNANPVDFRGNTRINSSDSTTWYGPDAADTNLVVMQITNTLSGNDTTISANFWINPTDLTNLGTAHGSATKTGDTGGEEVVMDMYRVDGNTVESNPYSLIIDEIRVGDTFSDVLPYVPEPASMTLLGIGALAVAARRRR